jgi:hypothetical protein
VDWGCGFLISGFLEIWKMGIVLGFLLDWFLDF